MFCLVVRCPQQRFDKRESRSEDIARIKELEEFIKKQEIEHAEMKQQVQILKNELVNREDNFNQKFAGGGAAQMQVAAPGNMPSWMPGGDKKGRGASAKGKVQDLDN